MKKFLLTVGLIAMTTLSHGAGAIFLASGPLYRYSIPGISDLTTIPLSFGVFWGTTVENLSTSPVLPLGFSSTERSGFLEHPQINNANTYPIPGSEPLQTVFMQIRGWDASFGIDWNGARNSGALFAETDVRQVTLLHDIGPAQVIWQSPDRTNPNRFYPLVFIPEPSTIALGLLGAGLLLVARRAGR